jgi:MYXO-CTERM domain-containing protein
VRCPRALVFVVAVAAARSAAGAGTPPGGLAGGSPFAPATGCKSCHGGFSTNEGTLFMPWDTWAGSMMANAARDPLFFASLTVAEQDRPGSGGFCLRCHTPSAYVESRTTPGNGANLSETDREGVQCSVCHRSIDASKLPSADPAYDANAPYVGNAQLFFDLGTPTDVTYHGPYDDSPFSPAHNFVMDPFVTRADSRLCGQCHQVDNPDEHLYDAAGNDTGRLFPLDTTYEEWEQSSFASGAGAKSCQNCHMPLEMGAYPVGSGAGNRDNPARHDFVGGNEWGPALLKAAFPGLRDAQYDYTRAATQANLRVTADLEIRALPAEGSAGGKIDLAVRVTNKAGHKFPTGYADGRRAWLEIAVVDSTGAVDVQSGEYDTATSELHEDEQLRLYEALHGRDGKVEDHIVLHRQIIRDSRIPPAGFVPTAATQIVGPIKFSDGGKIVNYDDAPFHVTLPNAVGTDVMVRVRLVFQSMAAHHVKALAEANTTDDRGTKLLQLWEQSGKSAPFVMAEVTRSVHVVAPPPSDGGCGCAAAGSPATGAGWLAFAAIALGAALRRRRRG